NPTSPSTLYFSLQFFNRTFNSLNNLFPLQPHLSTTKTLHAVKLRE
ncbi:hypothetical protein MPER_07443, partial [Moniliophthora perniciosa FA553]